MKTIFFSIPIGRYARSLLRSRLLAGILSRRDMRAVIVSTAARDPSFVKEFALNGQVLFEPMGAADKEEGFCRALLWKCGRRLRGSRTPYLLAMKMHHWLATRSEPIQYGEMFQKHQPALLVTAGCGLHTTQDLPLIREARNWKIPVLCVVHSWDNFSPIKDTLRVRPGYLAVWNPLMKEEVVRTWHFPENRIWVVGPLQFDHYYEEQTFESRDAFFKRLGLDPRKKLITIAGYYLRNLRGDCLHVVEHLRRAMREGKLAEPSQLVCRFHPIMFQKETKWELPACPDVTLDLKGRISPTLGWDPDLAESRHVANLIKHSDVLVNVASTVTIEAALLDTPVVNVAFDPQNAGAFKTHILKRHWEYHFRPVRETGASRIARDEFELIQRVNEYLKDPSLERQERAALKERICHYLDGKTHERVTALIQSLTVHNAKER